MPAVEYSDEETAMERIQGMIHTRAIEIAAGASAKTDVIQALLLRHFDECDPRQQEILRRFDKGDADRTHLRDYVEVALAAESERMRSSIGKIYSMLWAVAGALIAILITIVGFLLTHQIILGK